MVLSGISSSFPGLSQSRRQITHALLTRAPLEYPPKGAFPYDLHVLSTPPAFVLSQDQTLQFEPMPAPRTEVRDPGRSESTCAAQTAHVSCLGKNNCPKTVSRTFPSSKDRTLFSFQRPHEAPLSGLSTALGATRQSALRSYRNAYCLLRKCGIYAPRAEWSRGVPVGPAGKRRFLQISRSSAE